MIVSEVNLGADHVTGGVRKVLDIGNYKPSKRLLCLPDKQFVKEMNPRRYTL